MTTTKSRSLFSTKITFILSEDQKIESFYLENLNIPLNYFINDETYWLGFFNYIYTNKVTHTLYLNPKPNRYHQLVFYQTFTNALKLVVYNCTEEFYEQHKKNAHTGIKKHFQVLDSEAYNSYLLLYKGNKFIQINTNQPETSANLPYYIEAIKTAQAQQVNREGLLSQIFPIFDTIGNRYILVSTKLQSKKENKTVQTDEHAIIQDFLNEIDLMVVTTDATTRQVIDINKRALDFFNTTKERFIERNPEEFTKNPVIPLSSMTQVGQKVSIENNQKAFLDITTHQKMHNNRLINYSISSDVTQQVLLSKELTQEKRRLQATLDSIGSGVINVTEKGSITCINNQALNILMLDLTDVLHQEIHDVVNIRNLSAKTSFYLDLTKNYKSKYQDNYEIKRSDGHWIPISFSLQKIAGQPELVFVFEDITKERDYLDKIEHLQFYDQRTKLYNRHYMEHVFKGFEDEANYPISVIWSDVDDLHYTNQFFSHAIGDEILESVASNLKSILGERAIIGRWQDDDFITILPKTDAKQAEIYIEIIKKSFKPMKNINITPTASMGLHTCETKGNLYDAINLAKENFDQRKNSEGLRFREDVLEKMLDVLLKTSGETEAHSRRLEAICFALGYKMDLPPRHMRALEKLSLLHDIGKSQVSPDIINKKGPLSDLEWDTMKKHPIYGFNIVSQIPKLITVAPLILAHHEHWDGSGYPNGLKGDEIPLESRILAIADAYDAMTHNRSYRKAMSIEDAKNEILRGSGTQFDPQLVENFMQIPEGILEHI